MVRFPKVSISRLCHNIQSPLAKRAWWGAYGHYGFSWNRPLCWGPHLLPKKALTVISGLYSQLECWPAWRPTAPRDILRPHLCSDAPGLPAVSSGSVSVSPLSHTGFHQHGHIMHLMYAKCHAAPSVYSRRGGERCMPRAWNCTKASLESERCLPGRAGRTHCRAQLSLPSWFPLQEVVPGATWLAIQTMAPKPTRDVLWGNVLATGHIHTPPPSRFLSLDMP